MAKNTHIYYDVSLHNTNTAPKLAFLNDNRTTPLVSNPSNYHLSVVRFTIPTSYIPIFKWADAGSNTPDNNYYSVTINNSQVYLIYVPQNTTPQSALNTDYLFIYSYQQFIDAINVALNTAFIASAPAGVTAPPYMIFNSVTGICSLIAQTGYTAHSIYFNQPLFLFFDNFKCNRIGYSQATGKDVKIYIANTGANDYAGHPPGYALAGAVDSYIMAQEYDSLFLWNGVRSLVFTSSGLTIADEALNINNNLSISSSNISRKILTDFEFNIQSGISNNTLRSYIQYNPTAEYRLIDLTSTSPIYLFDIQIYFQMKDLTLIPLYIMPDESLSMKILFRKKM